MSTPALWVEVEDRAGLDAARASGIAAIIVVNGSSPLYGRPGDTLCMRIDERDGKIAPAQLAARLPVRAGILYRPAETTDQLVTELVRRGRAPIAAQVANAAEARRAVESGATALVVRDPALVDALRDTPGVTVIGTASGVAEVDQMLRSGAAGLLVRATELGALLATPAFAAVAAPPAGFARRAATGSNGHQPQLRSATIGALLDRAARSNGQRQALVHASSGRRLDYAELHAEAKQVGRALLALGVTPGERVVMWARNAPEWPLVQLGAAYAGVIVATANAGLGDEEIEQILANSGAAMLIAGTHRKPRTALLDRLARGEGPRSLRRVVALPEVADVPGAAMRWADFTAAAEGTSEAELARAASRTQPDDVSMILYTSGTTGFPKGVQLTHRAMLQNAAAVGANIRLSNGDRVCLPVPFHHCFGAVMGTLAAVTYGAAIVLPSEVFDADAVLRSVAAEHCTVLYGVPTMFVALLESPERTRTDLSSLRTGIIAGAPVPVDLGRRVAHELHIPQLVVAYGLTEAAPVVTQTSIDDPEDVRLGSVGRPILGAEVRAIDPATGKPVAAGTPGELVTRGSMVMRGYFDMPAETAQAIDRQGWLHTGDLATVDASGVWRIVGRIKDMIIRGGENIDPAAVESAGRRHPKVAEMHVVGVPSEYYGEEIFAFVRPAAGAQLTEDELLRHLAEHLGRFEVPRYVRFVESFPMTESGKVQRNRLRDEAVRAVAGMNGRPAVPSATTDGATHAAPGGRPALPLMPPRNERSAGSAAASGSRSSTSDSGPVPGPRSASQPPRGGWSRPDHPGWRWHPRKELNDMPQDHDRGTAPSAAGSADGAPVDLDEVRQRGQRIKTWGIVGDIREQIEATGEEPIMYKALGTPAQTHHPFNLYGDIKSQPSALRGTFEHADEIAQVARTLAERDFMGIVGLGSGTSQFVAQVANAAFARFAGVPGWDYDSQAFLRYPPPYDYSKLLAVAYSGSGSTVDTVAAARECRERGAYTLSLTSVEGSPVVQASDARILTAGGFDTGGSDTFHYTTRIAAAIYLALELGKLRNPGKFDFDKLQAQLLDTPRLMGEMFDAVDKRCRTIADMFLGVRSVLVVGAGANFGTAEEIALKFDEMSHIPAKSMNPGRHIHGALGLTEESILTVLVAPPGDSYGDLHDIARVTEQLKSPAVAIVSQNDDKIADIVDYVVRLPIEDEVLFTVLAVLPGQLIPYYCGVGLGLNPDTQRSNVPKHARVWNMLFPPGTH